MSSDIHHTDLHRTIEDFVVRDLMLGDTSVDLRRPHSFLELGILDSMRVLELVTFLEGKFGLVVQDEEIVPENFDSVGRLAAFVRGRKGG